MSTRSQLTKDLNESVKALLARRVKILLKNVVKLEIKGDKTENKVLVFSPCRLFVLAAKVPTRIDFHFHYLEIQAVESKKLNQLCLTVGDKVYSFLTSEESSSGETDAMIQALSTAIRQIFPTVPLNHIIRKVEVQPPQRLQHIRDAEMAMRHHTPESRAIGPCGGFSTQYACMCDYYNLPYREEVAWDVDNIYLVHGTRELSLKEFDYLEFKDLVPVIAALEHNTWFTGLRASNIKLNHDCMERCLNVLRKSLSLQCLYLNNIQVKWDFAHKLSLALIANSHSVLHTIDLSHNLIEDKGAASLCGFLAKVSKGGSQLVSPISSAPQGLVHLNLSHCGLTSKGVNQICHALSLNRTMDSSLTHLILSDNSLKDDVTNLCNFLAQPNVLKHLDISNTECTLETIFGALLRGCATHLVHLNVSRNNFSTKNSSKPGKQELPLSFKQFFTSALNLKLINISSCKLPLEALKHLLLGLACNESINQVSLDLSYNNLSLHGGAHVLESCIHGVRCLSSLDLTDTGMDSDLSSVLSAIGKNKSLKTLVLNKNLVNLKAKHIASVVHALVELLQDDECSIQSLSLVDCKLKNELNNVLSALSSNSSLQIMDITGNFVGDTGARLLAKSLQINSSLHTLHYDRNNITIGGYAELCYGLETNRTLKVLSYPIHDMVACIKLNAEKSEQVMRKLQTCLSRNMLRDESNSEDSERVVPSSASMVLNNSNYILDQMIVQQKDIVKVVSEDEALGKANEINLALSLIEDAEHCKSLMSTLVGDYVQNIDVEANEIHAQFGSMASELTATVHNYLQSITESMLKLTKDRCPTVMMDTRISTDLLTNSIAKIQTLDSEATRRTLVDNAGTQINKKIRDLSVSIAATIAETVSDKLVEALSKSYKSLLGDSKTRSSTPDVLRSMSRVSSDSSRNDSFHLSSRSQSDSSPIKLEYLNLATPHLSSKRKSVNGRKLRPKSVVDSAEGLSADDIPDLLPSLPTSAEESLDSVTELPVSVGNQLQHLVKSRPKRTKTRAPTRANPAALISNSIGEDTDDGLDAFFVAPTSGVVSPLSDDNSSISSLITDTPSPNNNNNTSTPSEHKSSIITGPFTQGTSRTLPHSKCAGVGEDVPRSRSSDNVGSHSKLGTNSPDLGDSSTSETTPTPNSLSKIDGTQHLKRNTKLTGTAVDLIKAKKSASEHFNCKETVSTSCDSLSSTSHSLTSSSTCNNISSSITTSTSNNITVSSIIKLRTAAFTSESNKTSSNGIPPKSPLPSKYSKDKGFEFSTSNNNNNSSDKGKVASLLGGSVKQRPWSMMDQNHTLDISSSGPSSLPLHINERRSSVKAMAANLNKQGSESPELKKKPVLEPPGSVRGFGKRPVPQPRPSILRSGDSKENECNEEPFSLPPVLT